MNQQTILQINSSGRLQGSSTRQLSDLVVQALKVNQPDLSIVTRDLVTGLPFIDEQWIGATFTPVEQRTETHKESLEFSDQLVVELEQASTIVIASPIYNFSIPAVLKAWIDLVARAQRTFRYTENGPEGLLKDKKAYIVVAAGGVPIGSAMDFATPYLKQVLGFIGISDVTIIDASNVNLNNDKQQDSAEKQVAEMI
ncbi:MAG: FMN-dependent NADH-azoreductase [Gammaproteobacteria bacterium]|nr:MAG: FMN-dependent NADH-azoreductase [Gammaproteobacteria bacterium]